MNQKSIILLAGVALVLGCEPKEPKSDAKTGGTAGTTTALAANSPQTPPGIPEKAVDLETFEKRASPSELPAEFEAKDPMSILAWGDRNDDNVIFWEKSKKEFPGVDGGPAKITTTLRTRYFTRSHIDNKWTSRRGEEKTVSMCSEKTTLEVVTGDWSLTDVSGDGMGEVSYAIRAGCRSDATPVQHSVHLIERTQRYTLDGESLVKVGDKESGGEISVGSFGKMPKLKEHAMKVWEATVRE